ncbi:MAG: hypothetical protein U0324_23540 [Polyangiales bacterium]
MRPALALALSLALAACGASRRGPRPTILNVPPPAPEPEANEVRIMPAALRPDAPDAPETAPGASLPAMARRALDGAQIDLVRCYERLLVRRPSAAGGLEVQLDLGRDGAVTRVHLDRTGGEDFAAIEPCAREVFAGLRVRDVDPGGRYISRVYAFTNPPIDRVVHGAVIVSPPPRPARPARPARAARRRGAAPPPPPPAPEAPAAPATPREGPGSLNAEELSRGLGDLAPLRACATIALRRARRPPAEASLRMTVGPDGRVTEAELTGAPAPVATCVAEAVREARYRASGIVVRTTLPLAFRR